MTVCHTVCHTVSKQNLLNLWHKRLEALAVDNGRAGLVILPLGDPHLLERTQGGQNGATDPHAVLSSGAQWTKGGNKSLIFHSRSLCRQPTNSVADQHVLKLPFPTTFTKPTRVTFTHWPSKCLSGGATTLIFMVEGAKAVSSSVMRWPMPVNMVLPPQSTTLEKRSL